jgi:hypothetical protein
MKRPDYPFFSADGEKTLGDNVKNIAWGAAIAIFADSLVSLLRVAYLSYADATSYADLDFEFWSLIDQIHSVTTLIMACALATFFVQFASRLKPDASRAGALRSLFFAGAFLVAVDMGVLNIISRIWPLTLAIDGSLSFGIDREYVGEPLVPGILGIPRALSAFVIGALALFLSSSLSGFARVAGFASFIVSLGAGLASLADCALVILLGAGWIDYNLFDEIRRLASFGLWEARLWLWPVFWLLFGAQLTSIAARIRNV